MLEDPLLAEIDEDDDYSPESEYAGGTLITLDTLSRDARATIWQLSQGMHEYMRKVTQLAQGRQGYEEKRGRDAVKPAGRGGLRR